MPDTCNSRSLSWLVKTCIPDDPRRGIAEPPPPPPEKDRRRHPNPPAAASITTLPDDLLLECLSRVPHSSLPSLPQVCRRFSLLLDSPAFLQLRRLRLRLRPTLLALSTSDLGHLSSASLPLLDSLSLSWTLSAAPIPAAAAFSHARVAALGRSIYLIGRSATLHFDTWTGTLAPRTPTLFPRKKFAAAAINGKIYVAGGSARTSALEEYDPVSDAWRVVAEAPVRRYGCVGAAAGGVFYIAGGLRVGGARGGWLDAAGSVDAYHVGAGGWRRSAAVVPSGGCVVGACGAGPHVYVLASHAVEVSFWRWGGGGRGRRGGEGWVRLEPPPVRMGGAVRFSCCAVGEAKVVAMVHVAAPCGSGWAVMVYDIAGREWSRGPDLPPGLRRAACACVEC